MRVSAILNLKEKSQKYGGRLGKKKKNLCRNCKPIYSLVAPPANAAQGIMAQSR
jgi:hypothetical protein